MYDPSIGRWFTEDPIGFDAGDADLYRYVANDPTNGVDPSGLIADNAIDIKKEGTKRRLENDGKVKFEDGKTVSVEVRTGVSYELNRAKVENAIQFKILSDKKDFDADFKPLAQDVHWLQLVSIDVIRPREDKPARAATEFMAFQTNERRKLKFILNGKGNTVVDSIDPAQAFADKAGLTDVGEEGNNFTRSYFDGPDVGKQNKDRIKADKYIFHFTTILVYKGKAYYQVKWKYEEPSRDNPITIESAEPITDAAKLPAELKARELSVGYQDVSDAEKAELKEPYPKIANPLDAKNRPK